MTASIPDMEDNAPRIFVSDLGDAVVLTPVTDGGHGYHVRLSSTRAEIPDEHKRTTYHGSIELAAARILWLTDLTGGTFKPAETPAWAKD